MAAWLSDCVKAGGVYLGVGPEQNFTYIAATRPRLAIITDIRRGNLKLHLMYKALFEMCATRADFVARLFTRARPVGLTAQSTASELMNAFLPAAPGDAAALRENLKAITEHLTKTRRFPLDADDLVGIEYVLRNLHRFGPNIHYTSSIGGRSGPASYAQLMSTPDRASGLSRTYLATEDDYARVRAMQASNLIVPIVGDFAGPKALRAVYPAFCANVASLPLDAASTFIRPDARGGGSFGTMASETAACPGK